MHPFYDSIQTLDTLPYNSSTNTLTDALQNSNTHNVAHKQLLSLLNLLMSTLINSIVPTNDKLMLRLAQMSILEIKNTLILLLHIMN